MWRRHLMDQMSGLQPNISMIFNSLHYNILFLFLYSLLLFENNIHLMSAIQILCLTLPTTHYVHLEF